LCGLAAAGLQIAVQPASPVPMVGASGAIAGVLGGYLVLFPRVKVDVLVPLPFFWPIFSVPAYVMLLVWIGMQVLTAVPRLSQVNPDVSSGVAVFAHIGGFACGALLVKLFTRVPHARLRRRWT
jgi:membrane associated rhomboid family serine protease